MRRYMKGKLLNTSSLGLIAFIAMRLDYFYSNQWRKLYKVEILIILGIFFAVSLGDYYRKLKKEPVKIQFNKRSAYVLICSVVGAALTWFINHKMGYGAVIANGLVGVMVATFLPNDLAGLTYTASFVGMSSLAVIPSMGVADIRWINRRSYHVRTTAEIYKGIGGKGGTTVALSIIITKAILRIFS